MSRTSNGDPPRAPGLRLALLFFPLLLAAALRAVMRSKRGPASDRWC
jgi:hypothetical protein